MSVHLIRHAEKECGEYRHDRLPLNDQPLNANGLAQAEKLAAFFKDIDIAEIRVSRYLRTGQTIRGVADERGLTPIVDPRLDEIDIGELDRVGYDGLRERHPDS